MKRGCFKEIGVYLQHAAGARGHALLWSALCVSMVELTITAQWNDIKWKQTNQPGSKKLNALYKKRIWEQNLTCDRWREDTQKYLGAKPFIEMRLQIDVKIRSIGLMNQGENLCILTYPPLSPVIQTPF